jgi:hypothetical protein
VNFARMNQELKSFLLVLSAVAIAFASAFFLYLALFNWWSADSPTAYRSLYISRGNIFFAIAINLHCKKVAESEALNRL